MDQHTKISRVFLKHNVRQAHLVSYLNKAGIVFSPASLSRVKRAGLWPKHCDKTRIKQLIETFLAELGASQSELDDLWGWYDATEDQPAEPEINPEPEDKDDLEPEMLSGHAKQFFKLRTHPFENEIFSETDVFLIDSYRLVLEEMLSAASAGSMTALIGECGAGKTIMRRAFIHRVQQDNQEIIVIEPARLDVKKVTAESLSLSICRALSIPNKHSAEDRDAAIEEALIKSANNGHLHLIVIEEAHLLTTDVIKLLKRIWELTSGFKRVIGILLIGQTELVKKLSSQDLREFTWRCSQIEMKPLGLNTAQYIRHKFSCIGVDADSIFTEDAFDSIYEHCKGRVKRGLGLGEGNLDKSYPLRVNHIVVKCLNLAAQVAEPKVTAQIVEKV